jgi:hypothetical protein
MLIIEHASLSSLLLGFACAAVLWLVDRLNSWLVATGLLLSYIVSLLGVILALPLYPWNDLVVLLKAMSRGLLLGRGMAPRFRQLFDQDAVKGYYSRMPRDPRYPVV